MARRNIGRSRIEVKSRSNHAEASPKEAQILSGIEAHYDPSLFRDCGLNDVLRSVAGDAYVKSSRGIRVRHSHWRSCWRFRGGVPDHHAIWRGGRLPDGAKGGRHAARPALVLSH